MGIDECVWLWVGVGVYVVGRLEVGRPERSKQQFGFAESPGQVRVWGRMEGAVS